jgi:glycine dehydrogenase subunit 1
MAHPYMSNSVQDIIKELLDYVGVEKVDDLFSQIPEDHRTKHQFKLPKGVKSEAAVAREVRSILAKNKSCAEYLSFLGNGYWQHYVPAICKTVVTRSEFLTSVWGTTLSDQGRFQALFEFQSLLGELLDYDFVSLPVYSWGCAAGHALRMAARITGRKEVIVPSFLEPERFKVIQTYCGEPELRGGLKIVQVGYDPSTGRTDLEDLGRKVNENTAAVYFENPNSFGIIEQDAAEIVQIAHQNGAEVVAGVDPISLGVLAPPGQYEADIGVGSLQPLGISLNAGGGVGGFIASRDEEKYARQYPTLQVGLYDDPKTGTKQMAMVLFGQTSYGARENGNDWTGNSVYLWAIASAIYMSMLGPEGFVELGNTILSRSHYFADAVSGVPGVKVLWSPSFFKEVVVDFRQTGKSVDYINKALYENGIFGGYDLGRQSKELEGCALYCVTEVHTKDDIERLVSTLRRVLS